MSHFSVSIFTRKEDFVDEKNGVIRRASKSVDELLAPYQENNMGDCPEKYLEFFNKEEEMLEEYTKDRLEVFTIQDKHIEIINLVEEMSKEARGFLGGENDPGYETFGDGNIRFIAGPLLEKIQAGKLQHELVALGLITKEMSTQDFYYYVDKKMQNTQLRESYKKQREEEIKALFEGQDTITIGVMDGSFSLIAKNVLDGGRSIDINETLDGEKYIYSYALKAPEEIESAILKQSKKCFEDMSIEERKDFLSKVFDKVKEQFKDLGLIYNEIPYPGIYKSFEEYAEKWQGYSERDEKTGKYGYWTNPNTKWDWYQIGGRWQGMLLVKDDIWTVTGARSLLDRSGPKENPEGYKWTDVAKLADIQWDKMKELQIESLEKNYDEAMKEESETTRYFMYGIRPGITKEEYVKDNLGFSTFAVITPEGKWHEKGSMGWFGMSSETEEESHEWNKSFMEAYIDNADPELVLTIVDCHI